MLNQCDGCRRGLPIVDGVHRGSGYDMIACTADRYQKCEFTVDLDGGMERAALCGRPAKAVTPTDGLNPVARFVCGIHRRSVDSMYVRLKSNLRCEEVT